MKNILIAIFVLVFLIGCEFENKNPQGKWSLFGGFSKNKEEKSGEQIIYHGQTNASYRITCDRSDMSVKIEVDNVTIKRLVKGQTIDVEGKNIKIFFQMTSSDNPYASGTYKCLEKNITNNNFYQGK